MSQFVFERYEKKFLLDEERFHALAKELGPFLLPDIFVRSQVSNIYFDTDDFLLIQRSLEKPNYKEKLRLRAYGAVTDLSTVFVELKKKYDGVVFKRRVELSLREAMDFLERGIRPEAASGVNVPDDVSSFLSPFSDGRDREQILDEIGYCRDFYGLMPRMYISYERNSYLLKDYPELRLTFDRNIRYRTTDADLLSKAPAKPLIAPEWTVMEMKTPGTLPAFLSQMLSRNGIYMTSFSKYGAAYRAERTGNGIC